MPLHCVKVYTSSKVDPEYVSEILFELGAISVTITDQNEGTAEEQPIYAEPSPNGTASTTKPRLWANSIISSLFPLSYNVETLQMLVATHFDLPQFHALPVQRSVFDEKSPEEWVHQVQKTFKPIVVDDVRIYFPWHHPEDNLLDVQLDPGMAFGTGEHPTTQLCIKWLQKSVKPNMSVLDFGTGSGILAIVATMLKENVTAVGVDLDITALRMAQSNAKRNSVESCITFCHNDHEVAAQHDIVIANILAGPLLHLADELADRMKPDAEIALSGILVSQAADVIECYQRHGICLRESIVQEGWVLLVSSRL